MIGRFVEPVEDVPAGNIVGLVRDRKESKLLGTLATCGDTQGFKEAFTDCCG